MRRCPYRPWFFSKISVIGGLEFLLRVGGLEPGLVIEERGPGKPGDLQQNRKRKVSLEGDEGLNLHRRSCPSRPAIFPGRPPPPAAARSPAATAPVRAAPPAAGRRASGVCLWALGAKHPRPRGDRPVPTFCSKPGEDKPASAARSGAVSPARNRSTNASLNSNEYDVVGLATSAPRPWILHRRYRRLTGQRDTPSKLAAALSAMPFSNHATAASR